MSRYKKVITLSTINSRSAIELSESIFSELQFYCEGRKIEKLRDIELNVLQTLFEKIQMDMNNGNKDQVEILFTINSSGVISKIDVAKNQNKFYMTISHAA